MAAFDITMKHTEESLEALAHMQYDLFCQKNRIVRTLLSAGMVEHSGHCLRMLSDHQYLCLGQSDGPQADGADQGGGRRFPRLTVSF